MLKHILSSLYRPYAQTEVNIYVSGTADEYNLQETDIFPYFQLIFTGTKHPLIANEERGYAFPLDMTLGITCSGFKINPMHPKEGGQQYFTG